MIDLEVIAEKVLANTCSVDFPGRKHYCGDYEGRMYRVVVDEDSIKLYQELFDDPAWLLELFQAGMVSTKLLGQTGSGNLVLEHKKFAFQSMFHEWTWTQKKDLASMIIRIQKKLSEKDLFLSDPHVFNVAFDDSVPVYFDFGSITRGPYPIREWIRNFWLGQNWMESWMARLNITYTELQDFLEHPEHVTLENQLRNIERLTSEIKILEWSQYDKKTFNVNDLTTWQEKHNAVKNLMELLPEPPKKALDVGSNTGDFCHILLRQGVEKVCGFDIDEATVEVLYKMTKERNLPITAVVGNITDLYGWHAVDFGEISWNSLYQPNFRYASELVLCVALIHHVCYFREFPMAVFAEILANYSTKYLIIEWIPYDDRYLEGSINRFGKDRSEYTEEEFVATFTKYFPTVVGILNSTDQVRKMYLFSKEPKNAIE